MPHDIPASKASSRQIPPSPTPDSQATIARAAGLIALGNVSSRVLGLVRETVIAHYFGASGLVSAFTVASRLPTMIYDLLIGGMLSAALVPVFSELALRDRDELWQAVSALLSLATVVLGGLVLLMELLAPQIAWLLGSGYDAELLAITTRLIRIILPAVLLFGLSGIVTGLLYSLQRFTFPAFGATVYNLGIVIAVPLLAGSLDIYSLAVGSVLGALIQLLIMLPDLRDVSLRFYLNPRHPALRRILALYLPIALGLVISQIQVAVDTNLTSRTGEQSLAWMRDATTLIQFPHGLVSVAISLAVLPSLSRLSVRHDEAGYRRTLAAGIRMVLVLIVPATVGLWLLARPAVALIFEHGAFTPRDTAWTALALRGYLVGLIFAAVDWPLNYAFYARQDTLTPALVGVLSVGVYLGVALSLLRPLGMMGLVLADSAKHISHMTTMLLLLRQRVRMASGEWQMPGVRRILFKIAVATAGMGLAVHGVLRFLEDTVNAGSLLGKLVLIGGPGVLGAGVYAALCALLRVEELSLLRETILRGLRERAG